MREMDQGSRPAVTAEEVDRALRLFWAGHPDEFDRLLGDTPEDEPHVCRLLLSIIRSGRVPRATGPDARSER